MAPAGSESGWQNNEISYPLTDWATQRWDRTLFWLFQRLSPPQRDNPLTRGGMDQARALASPQLRAERRICSRTPLCPN